MRAVLLLDQSMQAQPYFKTIKVSELPPGEMKTVEIDGEAVLLVNVDGRFYGMGAYCGHELWDLAEGALEGTEVICPGHGSIWDLRTGKGRFEEPVKDEPVYDVKAESDYLYARKKD